MSTSNRRELTTSSSDLFGKDDSEFLEALRKVNMPDESVLPSALKEPSSSPDLFGTEDSAFLDALSTTTLPGDMVQPSLKSSVAASSNRMQEEHMDPNTESLKRKHTLSPENLPSFSHVVGTPDAKDETSYTDSDIYGPSKFHGYGEYMRRKRAKLSIQNSEIEETNNGKKSSLFRGLALYINGKTNPSVQELRKLILHHGGIFHPYLDRKKMVTHIIASNLTPSKVLEFKNMKVVTPEWLLESVKAGTLLPWKEFVIGAGSRIDESQGKAKVTNGFTIENLMSREDTSISVTDSAQVTGSLGRERSPPSPNEPSSNISLPIHPLHGTDPAHREETSGIPTYAAHSSNPYAKRKMEDPQWRAEHTAVAPGFIDEYYRHSRLHHLSTWKTELQELVAKALERVENGDAQDGLVPDLLTGTSEGTSMNGIQFYRPSPKKGKAAVTQRQTIMHCDFDSFFVSAGLVDRPHLRGKPVVVCHSQGGQVDAASTSEIASSSYEARKFGIKNGMSLGQAKKLCSDLHTIPYEFERYKSFSLQFYTILMSYADDLQAVSVDEALVDVSSTVESARRASTDDNAQPSPDFAKELAETIRGRIRVATGCEVSIGISHNILLARVATRRAKPAGSYHILPDEVSDILSPLDIADLRGFGRSIRSKIEAKFGVTTLGELAKQPKGTLCDTLGKKTGETLWKAVRGIDDTKIESDHLRKSVSCEINYGIRFNNDEEAEEFVHKVAVEVSERLMKIGMCGRSLTLKVMTRDPKAPVEAPKFLGHGKCDTTNKTAALAKPGGRATADEAIIGECAWKLLKGMRFDAKELRGIGIHVQKLEKCPAAVNNVPGLVEQSVLPFEKSGEGVKTVTTTPRKGEPNDQRPRPGVALPSFSQLDPSVFQALPADIRAELELEYTRTGSEEAVAGPSRHANAISTTITKPLSPIHKGKQPPSDIARITRKLAPKSRPSISPTKIHPMFAKRTAPNAIKVQPTELKLLNIDAEVWAELPVELQREQLAALRAANVGTGMAIRASMSSQAKQQRILTRWRLPRRSPSVGIRGQRLEIFAKPLELPGLKQRGKSKREELRVSETEDIQAVISQWVEGFEDDGPRQGDVEYFGKFLARCVETDVGAERGVSALKWWMILLRRRWSDAERTPRADEEAGGFGGSEAGQYWWNAFWEVKNKMDGVVRKRYGGCLSLK